MMKKPGVACSLPNIKDRARVKTARQPEKEKGAKEKRPPPLRLLSLKLLDGGEEERRNSQTQRGEEGVLRLPALPERVLHPAKEGRRERERPLRTLNLFWRPNNPHPPFVHVQSFIT
uniref:Uncharacterized protein n=1 Tax=Bracon brevicornis TaxID=1563983 RepID=A0A6V7LPU6_9HYME